MAAHPALRHHPRRGTSLVELMVALTISATALLSLVGTSATLLRSANRSALDARLSATADRRLEALAAEPCPTLASGELDTPPIHERWTVAVSPHTASLTVTASAQFGATTRTASRTTSVRCPASP